MKRLTKKQKEDRACDVIIAGILKGWKEKEWKEVFKRINEKESKERRCKHLNNLKSQEDNSIYG